MTATGAVRARHNYRNLRATSAVAGAEACYKPDGQIG